MKSEGGTIATKRRDLLVLAADEMQSALSAGLNMRPDALIQLGSPLIVNLADRIASTVARFRVPAISMFKEFAEDGSLMSYGPNVPSFFSRSAHLVAAILKGAKPAEVPAEAPTRFVSVVNLKAAAALGINVSHKHSSGR